MMWNIFSSRCVASPAARLDKLALAAAASIEIAVVLAAFFTAAAVAAAIGAGPTVATGVLRLSLAVAGREAPQPIHTHERRKLGGWAVGVQQCNLADAKRA